MALINPSLPVVGLSDSTEDPKVQVALSQILSLVNGSLDSANIADGSLTAADISAALAQQIGLTNAGNVGRGKSIIATTEARTNVAYGTLTTPDKVTGIVLPTDGLIFVAYQATWQESVAGAARAAIFLGANQVQVAEGEPGAPALKTTAAATSTNAIGVDGPLASWPGGLASVGSSGPGSYPGDATTGQVMGFGGENTGPAYELAGTVRTMPAFTHAGGPCAIFAAAGTYDVSVQFKATSGTVTAKNRKLWCWTVGF